ncbi:MAG TPA: hypothetical protein VKE70_22225 [Candidatus Solibacter sp.]|nr:hypothetical protein [Candidatus Solibacter sp.]
MRNELQSVLASRAFRHSRSQAKLLRYICSKALLEKAEPITEYTIAVDVLGKAADFKESRDAGVRVEVHRLRKRLADFYDQEGVGHFIRIVIPTGQYTPHFVVCDNPGAESVVPAAEVALEVEPAPIELPTPDSPAHTPTRRFTRLQVAVAAGVVAMAAAVSAAFVFRAGEPLDSFWRPVLSSPNPILLCFGNVEGGQHGRSKTAATEGLTVLEYHGLASEMMLVPDAVTVSRFAGLLQAKGKRYRVSSQSEATFADLQSGPAVLIGLANNDWTERLTGKLRFWVEHRIPGRLLLRDRENLLREDWAVDYRAPYVSLTRDYALVVRVLDPKTEQMVVTAAGLTAFGTLAAGEFLTSPEEFRKIKRVAPAGWEQKNFELVLSTDVIRGKSGHASIVAAHFW